MTTTNYRIEGLSCNDCAQRLEAAVKMVPGVDDVKVDYITGRLAISTRESAPPTDGITDAVRNSGYRVLPSEAGDQVGPADGSRRGLVGFFTYVLSKRDTRLTSAAALLTLIGLLLSVTPILSLAPTLLFAAAIGVGGAPLARFAWQELSLSKRLGINVLMVIAVIGAMIIGEWAEAAIVVVLFSLGEALEGYAAEQSRSALARLLDLAPPVALLRLPRGEVREVPVDRLSIGDVVLVRPGDRVSVDGLVRSGESGVDQSPITGESMPVEKGAGDEVFAGTINTSGALEVEVIRLAQDSTLSRMVELVQEAQLHQSPAQRFVDRFATVYTPTVTALAALVAIVPPLAFGQPFWGDSGWLMRALQMLVIACPCALVISTPVSLVSAMTNAASHGVLIKGGRYLEALSQVGVFAFDKTGTLTEGRPVTTDVIDVCECSDCPEECGLQHAAALEAQSTHPLALALLAEAERRGVAIADAQNVTLLGGRGLEGIVNGEMVTVASHAHFDEVVPHGPDACQKANQLASQGKTVIMVQHDDNLCAIIGVADQAREESPQVIAELREMGLRAFMLTGDNNSVAQEIARQVGVDEVYSDLLPADKLALVTELRESGIGVAMIGDGVNDAPALAAADVGIAMGGAGSAQAMETADAVLMGNDLSQLPFTVRLSRRTRTIVTSNIIIALVIKAAIFGLAAAGLATLWLAIVADVGASLVVILNGMRLRSFRAK